MAELDLPFSLIQETLKRTVSALDAAEIPFLIGGSLASWARGGPATTHDLDVIVKPEDASRAQEALVGAGMRAEDPPEPWLLKVWDGDVLIDLIFEPAGLTVDDQLLARAELVNAAAMDFRVPQADLSIQKSQRLRERTAGSPYATAFFCLLDELGIVDDSATAVR